MDDQDIWRTAILLLKQYGARAELEASLRADEFLAAGDLAGQRVWRRIVRSIRSLGPATDPLATKH